MLAIVQTLLLVLLSFPPSVLPAPATPDFIVVGGGTAGCVLAANLCTLLPSARITLLERAVPRKPPAEFLVRAPLNAFLASQSPALIQLTSSLPNPGLNARPVSVAIPATLGGSSAINAMQFTVPVGNAVSGWHIRGLNFSTARRFYAIARNKVRFAPQQPPFRQIYANDYLTAATKAGFSIPADPFDGRVRNAVWDNFVAIDKKGRRIDACSAYLFPALATPCAANLRLVQSATVTKIKLDSRRKRAIGVEYVSTRTGNLSDVRSLSASTEVVVAAGPYGSPHLLQLSGIGPERVLRAAGVEPLVDLAVGVRTQARAAAAFVSQYAGVRPEPATLQRNLNATAMRQFLRGEGGIYGKANAAGSLTVGRAAYSILSTTAGFGTGVGDLEVASFCLENPVSFGSLKLRDANPFSPPVVDTNLLGSKADVERMLRCLRKVSQIHTQLNKKFELVAETPSGPALNETALRGTAGFGTHYVGGCRVGAVVSDTLKVNGIAGLRVVDASVLRRIPQSAGTMGSVYMLAEYASRQIAKGFNCVSAGRRECGDWPPDLI